MGVDFINIVNEEGMVEKKELEVEIYFFRDQIGIKFSVIQQDEYGIKKREK